MLNTAANLVTPEETRAPTSNAHMKSPMHRPSRVRRSKSMVNTPRNRNPPPPPVYIAMAFSMSSSVSHVSTSLSQPGPARALNEPRRPWSSARRSCSSQHNGSSRQLANSRRESSVCNCPASAPYTGSLGCRALYASATRRSARSSKQPYWAEPEAWGAHTREALSAWMWRARGLVIPNPHIISRAGPP